MIYIFKRSLYYHNYGKEKKVEKKTRRKLQRINTGCFQMVTRILFSVSSYSRVQLAVLSGKQ